MIHKRITSTRQHNRLRTRTLASVTQRQWISIIDSTVGRPHVRTPRWYQRLHAITLALVTQLQRISINN